MSRARTFADLATASEEGSLSNRNMIINGNFLVDQRKSGGTHTGLGTYYIDRWQMIDSGNLDDMAIEVSQNDDIPDGIGDGKSFKYQLKTVESALAADEQVAIAQTIEAQNLARLNYGTSSAKSATLSFYVKSSLTGTFAVSMYQEDGDDIIGSTYTINSADTWERKTITFSGNTSQAFTLDNGVGLVIRWQLWTGSNFTGTTNTSWGSYAAAKLANGHTQNGLGSSDESTWQLAFVQFEVGEVATSFEHESFGDTLARCQRYYCLAATAGTDPMGTGSWYGSTEIDWFVKFPVTMRAKPSLEATSGTNYYRSIGSNTYDDFNGVAISNDKSIEGAYLYATNAAHGASGTQGDASIVIALNASAKVALLAEL
jgi:hypothetical protein